jgi:hypothetical protein
MLQEPPRAAPNFAPSFPPREGPLMRPAPTSNAELLIYPAIAAALALAWWWQRPWLRRMVRRRAAEWQRLAATLGFAYEPAGAREVALRQPHGLLHRGREPRISNVIHGSHRGRMMLCFDHTFGQAFRGDVSDHMRTCVLMPLPVAGAALTIVPVPEDPAKQSLVRRDIEFESDDFNRRYDVGCEDRRFAFDVLHARAIELILRYRPLEIELREGMMLFTHGESMYLPIPEATMSLIDGACDFAELLPGYLVG